MKMKKLLSLLTAAALSASCFVGMAMTASAASAATVNDLQPISTSMTYWFDEATSNGTVKISGGALFGDSHFYSPKGNTAYAKATITVDDEQHNASLRLKNVQNTLVFKTAKDCDITIYTQSDNKRGTVVTSTELAEAYTSYDAALAGGAVAVQPVSTTEFTYSATGEQTHYLSSYNGDFYIAGVKVDVKSTETPGPTSEPTSVPEPTSEPTPTPEPTATPEPNEVEGVEGTVEDLVAATETTTYNLLADALAVEPTSATVVYRGGKLFYDNTIFIATTSNYGLMYYSNKTSYNLDGTQADNGGIRVKTNQDVIGIKLAAGATVEANITGGGGSDRYATISTTADAAGDLVKSETLAGYASKTVSYTAASEQIVYISATGDSFLSQVRVTVPTVTAPSVDNVNTTAYVADAGDPVVAVTAEVTAGSSALTGIKWVPTVSGSDVAAKTADLEVSIAKGTPVTCGVIITITDSAIDPSEVSARVSFE